MTFPCGILHVVAQFVANPGSPKWTAIAVYENPLLLVPGLALEQRFQECDGFGPERAHSLLLALADNADSCGRLKSDFLRAQVEHLLNSGAGVVQQSQQGVIALALQGTVAEYLLTHRERKQEKW